MNGTTVSKTIENCAIKGASYVCFTSIYELTTGESATWSFFDGPTNHFSITPINGGRQVQVTTSSPSGKTATLKAVANGKT